MRYLLLALLCGCSQTYYKSLPRDGTPVLAYVDPSVLVSKVDLEIGARLWDQVGVNFQLSQDPNPNFTITAGSFQELPFHQGVCARGQSEDSILIRIALREDANWMVVGHELGHALNLGHTKGCSLMGTISCVVDSVLTEEDLNEFERTELLPYP